MDFNATAAVESFTGVGLDTDRVIFTNMNQANAGDIFNGGGGTDSIVINASGVDLSPVSLSSFEVIELGLGGSVQLTAAQVSGAFPSNLSVIGTAGSSQSITIFGAFMVPNNFSAAAWTFSQWDDGDGIAILGGGLVDNLTGSIMNDVLFGGPGADILTGGSNGTLGDTVVYFGSAAGVTVNLTLGGPQVSAGDASGDVLSGIENVFGSINIDTLTGDGGDNILSGEGGADILNGGGNTAFGDTASYASSTVGVTVDLSLGGRRGALVTQPATS